MEKTMYTELYHHGILGQKWGIRRYQNPDGSLTEEGKKHYGYKYSDHNREVFRNRINTAKKAGSVIGGAIGAGVGLAGDVAFTLGTGYIAPYLQVTLPVATSTVGARAVSSVIENIGYRSLKDFDKNAQIYKQQTEQDNPGSKSAINSLRKDYSANRWDQNGLILSNESKKTITEIANDKTVKSSYKKIKDLSQDYSHYWSMNSKDKDGYRLVDKYSILAGLISANEKGLSGRSKEFEVRWFRDDDGEQNDYAYSLYLLDKGKHSEVSKAIKDYKNALNNTVKDYFGNHYEDNIGNDKFAYPVNKFVTDKVNDELARNGWNPSTYAFVNDESADYASKELNKAKKEYDKYKNV